MGSWAPEPRGMILETPGTVKTSHLFYHAYPLRLNITHFPVRLLTESAGSSQGMSASSVEAQIAAIVVDQNRPFGLQQLVDLGATKGLKKAQVTKAVDALAADGRIIAKVRPLKDFIVSAGASPKGKQDSVRAGHAGPTRAVSVCRFAALPSAEKPQSTPCRSSARQNCSCRPKRG